MSHPHAPSAAISAEFRRVEQAVLDYIEGWHAGDVERMGRSQHPELAKRTPVSDLGKETGVRAVTRQQMIELTAAGGGGAFDGVPSIEIDLIFDEMATARVRSRDYLDFLHLVKTPQGWQILNVLFRPVD